jgi:type II secretory pathway component PulF
MEDQELRLRLDAIDKKLEETFRSAEKTRKYILWTVIATVACFVIPLIGLAFVIPSFISSYAQIGGLQ